MKIICIGRNYAEHARELNNEIPKEPVIFMKPETALANRNAIIFYPEFTNNLQYECEIVLKINKSGKNILEKEAFSYFNEWTVGIDFTARDLQQNLKDKGLPWEKSKAFDQSAVVGDWHPIPQDKMYTSTLELKKNGEIVQSGNSSDLLFSFEQLIAHCSQFFTLEKGDLIFTGTPQGVGPVLKKDQLTGYLNEQEMFHIHIH